MYQDLCVIFHNYGSLTGNLSPFALSRHPASRRLSLVGTLLAALLLLALPLAFGLDFSRLQQSLTSRFGNAPLALFTDWKTMLDEGSKLGEKEKLRRV
ncbi:MAG: hypothetical protein FWD50_05305, partial [Betaproteobacteria bacterium]|nr:hypothetical protein [Betaproteobacteria bacterium]